MSLLLLVHSGSAYCIGWGHDLASVDSSVSWLVFFVHTSDTSYTPSSFLLLVNSYTIVHTLLCVPLECRSIIFRHSFIPSIYTLILIQFFHPVLYDNPFVSQSFAYTIIIINHYKCN